MGIEAGNSISNHLNIILKHYVSIMNAPVFHLELFAIIHSTTNIAFYRTGKLLDVKSRSPVDGSVENYSRQLKHFCYDFFANEKINAQSMISQLVGNLLNLSRLSIFFCDKVEGKLPLLFNSVWPQLTHLNLLRTRLSAADMGVLCLACNGPEKLLPNLTSLRITVGGEEKEKCWTKLFGLQWLNLRLFYVHSKFEKGSRGLFDVIRDNQLISLTSLIIETPEHATIESLCLDQLPNLQSLFFRNCFPRDELQKSKDTSVLSELGFSSYCGLSGILSSLICKNFQLMTTLILTNIELEDLNILNQAKAKGMLPILRHLDISGDPYSSKKLSLSEFMTLFHGSCTWNGLSTLDIRWTFVSSEDDLVIDYMNEIVSRGYLPSLQKLGINLFQNRNVHWNRLERLLLVECKDDALRNIADRAFWEYLPALSTLCIEDFEGYDADIVRYLSRLGVSSHKRYVPFDNMYDTEINCVCGT